MDVEQLNEIIDGEVRLEAADSTRWYFVDFLTLGARELRR